MAKNVHHKGKEQRFLRVHAGLDWKNGLCGFKSESVHRKDAKGAKKKKDFLEFPRD